VLLLLLSKRMRLSWVWYPSLRRDLGVCLLWTMLLLLLLWSGRVQCAS
jgi:hypothetical protein